MPNRLAHESSPYLLQHAHNPVDWYPWGPEAFAAARTLNRPIFLSVGYSTCYWCHVMERESFENPMVAAEMNARFINIKVDREERPDVDSLYMLAVQLLTHSGGWPMSVFLTPDLRPFHGGTYWPPDDRHGRPGFLRVIRAIDEAWKNRPEEVEQSAAQLTDILRHYADQRPEGDAPVIDETLLNDLISQSLHDYDPAYGGFGHAPKFPRQTLLDLLLAAADTPLRTTIEKPLLHTLDAMAAGGIRDQLGSGFHRYSTDERWLVPHFEIMLYDNAMLGRIYAEAYRLFGHRRHAEVARGVFDFVLSRMTGPAGEFFTAIDAEVDAHEGGSYLWTREQVRDVLGEVDAAIFCRAYGLDEGSNFADPHGATHEPFANVLYLPDGLRDANPALDAMRRKLLAARDRRKQPLLDTKVLTAWNALMIRALAAGGRLLDEPHYTQAAARAAEFLLKYHRAPDGGLYRVSRDGKAKCDASLDDYAFLALALVELADATGEHRWRDEARQLLDAVEDRFAADTGGFFFTQAQAADLIIRQKIATDSPLPSGNAAAALAYVRLGEWDKARAIIAAFAHHIAAGADHASALAEAALACVRQGGAIMPSIVAFPGRPLSPDDRARNLVQVSAAWIEETVLRVAIDIAEGWHLYAHDAPAGLTGTELIISGATPARIDYPPAEKIVYSGETLAVYRGRVAVDVRFAQRPAGKMGLSLRYQPCDDKSCLPAMTKTLPTP